MAISSDKLKEILHQQQEYIEKSQVNLITALTQWLQIQLAAQNSANSTKNFCRFSDKLYFAVQWSF